MNDLIKLYFDPAGDTGAATAEPSSVGEAMMSAFDKAEGEQKTDAPADKPEGETKPKFAWGDEERRKARAEIKDEDELDLGYEEEIDGKKSPAKRSLRAIKETAKWLKDNEDLVRSAVGMREQFANNPALKDWFNKSWGKIYEGNKYNPEAVARLSQALEGKAEDVKDKIGDTTDDIKEMEKLIEELDADSPQAKILRSNINGLKATRAQLKEALGTIKTLQDKSGEIDKFRTGFEETQKNQKTEAEAKQAGELFDSTLGALTSKEYKFDDADDSKEFESSIRDTVATQAHQGKINNDQEFTKAIQDAAKATFERISRRNERVVNEYLKRKGKLPPEKEVKDKKETEKEQTIGEAIADGLFSDKK